MRARLATRSMLVVSSVAALCAAAVSTPGAGMADGATTPPVLVSVAGDIACGTTVAAYNGGAGTATQCHQKYTSDLILGSDAVWTLGDHVYPTATTTQLNAAYEPTWGRMKAVTYPSLGDHDHSATGDVGFLAYFGNPAPYYSFDMGGWHVISLDSEIDHSADSVQVAWLRQDLAASAAGCVAAYWGEPRWTSGKQRASHQTFDPFWQVLYAAHADLVLSGDTHNYERFAKVAPSGLPAADGIREFVVGTGGRSLVGFPNVLASSQVRKKSFGVLQLTLQDGSYGWQFIDESRTVLDSGSETCT